MTNEKLAPNLAPHQVRVPYEFKSSDFLEKYKRVVFPSYNSTIKIWKEDVKIFFDPTVPNKHRRALLDFADGLSRSVDSLNIVEVTNREESNYLIYYINSNKDSIYEKRIKSPHAGFYVNWNGKHQLEKASLQLNTTTIRTDHYQISHLKYQFFRSLGYFRGSDKVECAGYLSNCNSLRNLTDLDMELLKYHYSYGMCKGITLANFEKIHRQMKETLELDPTAKVYVVHTL